MITSVFIRDVSVDLHLSAVARASSLIRPAAGHGDTMPEGVQGLIAVPPVIFPGTITWPSSTMNCMFVLYSSHVSLIADTCMLFTL
jgi:hypothetical protein